MRSKAARNTSEIRTNPIGPCIRPDLSRCFEDEGAALELVQTCLWANGVVCPHCGETRRTGLLKGASTSTGTYKCYGCRKLFSVRTGTIFENSHVPLSKWLKALFLTRCGADSIKPYQLSQAIKVSFKTAALMIAQIKRSAVECGIRTSDDAAEEALPGNDNVTLAPMEHLEVGSSQTTGSPAPASDAKAARYAKAP
jgi:transposase-like protein